MRATVGNRSDPEAATEAVIRFDSSARICGWDQAAEAMFGRAEASCLGSDLSGLILDTVSAAEWRSEFQRLLGSPGSAELDRPIELELRDKFGGSFPARMTISALPAADGSLEFQAVIIDITTERSAVLSAAKLDSMVERSADALIGTDISLRINSWNPAAAELFGYDSVAAEGKAVLMLFGSEHDLELGATLSRVRGSGQRIDALEISGRRSDGKRLALQIDIAPLSDSSGEIVGLSIAARDNATNLEAKQRAESLAVAVASTEEAIIVYDLEGTITSWNEAAETLYGWPAEEIIGKPMRLILPPDRSGEPREVIEKLLGGTRLDRFESCRRGRDGSEIPVEINAKLVKDQLGDPVAVSSVATDISERKRFQSQIEHLAEHDPLTGLHNRNRFKQEIDEHLALSARSGRGGAVILVDLDHFKFVNDTYGQQAGDDLLRAVAQTVSASLRDGDVCAHLGGDEFALLLPETDQVTAEKVAAALLAAISSRIRDQLNMPMTASAAIAGFGPDGPDLAETLIANADMALFDAKESGRNKLVVFSGDRTPQLRWAERTREALANDELVLFAQPIMDLRSGQVVKHELLLRMSDPKLGVVEPSSFLATAERLGLIGEIDRWVVAKGIGIAAAGHTVEINLSGASMSDHDLLVAIEDHLTRTGARPENVIFEITETMAIASIAEATAFARRLEEIGCKFALDDFGTGFGSFVTLKHLPVAILKIDGEFVRGLTDSETDRQIVKAIVRVAKTLGQKTVAEWVGDQATLDLVRELGVDYAQGWAVGRPEEAYAALGIRAGI